MIRIMIKMRLIVVMRLMIWVIMVMMRIKHPSI